MILDLLMIIIILYVIINIISIYLCYADKKKAIDGSYRTRETTLLLAGLIGPFGAVIGMQVFRHKTQKAKFKIIYFFLALHIIRIAVWIVFLI